MSSPAPLVSTTQVSALALVRAWIRPYLGRGLSLPRIAALLFVLALPAISLALRLRARRPMAATESAAADVRRRLGARKNIGLWRAFWEEAVRAVSDTVAMGGRGLV